MPGCLCGDRARERDRQGVIRRDSAPVEEPCAQVGLPDDDHTGRRVGSRGRAVTGQGGERWMVNPTTRNVGRPATGSL
jgi:hypothetical protein